MDLSHHTAADRAQIEGFIHGKPKRRAVIEQMLALRATKTTDAERRAIDEKVMWMVTPSKLSKVWLAALVIVPIVVILGAHFYDGMQHDAALRDGVAVVARVERLARGNCMLGEKGSTCLELSLQLWPTNAAPYTASLTHDIENMWIARVQPGSYLTVVVDKNDPQRVSFDERAMQIAAPAPPPGATTP